MDIRQANKLIIPVGLSLLNGTYGTQEARLMLLAIGQQESGFQHRKQVHGPAVGWWQFELSAATEVLTQQSTKRLAIYCCNLLGYDPSGPSTLKAIEHNDLLATVFARLLLYRYPGQLPQIGEEERAWEQYIHQWRPGKPDRNRWTLSYRMARNEIGAEQLP